MILTGQHYDFRAMAAQGLAPADLEVVQQISAGHGPAREEVLSHPVVLSLHLHIGTTLSGQVCSSPALSLVSGVVFRA